MEALSLLITDYIANCLAVVSTNNAFLPLHGQAAMTLWKVCGCCWKHSMLCHVSWLVWLLLFIYYLYNYFLLFIFVHWSWHLGGNYVSKSNTVKPIAEVKHVGFFVFCLFVFCPRGRKEMKGNIWMMSIPRRPTNQPIRSFVCEQQPIRRKLSQRKGTWAERLMQISKNIKM